MVAQSLVSLFIIVPLLTTAATEAKAASVHVTVHGVVRVTPDQVVIRLTLSTTDDDLIRVRENSEKDARAILALAKKHGVKDDGFEVSRLDLSLDYNEQLQRQIYEVQRDVTLRLNDLRKLDSLLSELLDQRSLKVRGVKFTSSKAREHAFEARSRAVADAKEKAAHLAELNGLKRGPAREIHITHEAQAPFVTSVIPVVGSNQPGEDPFGGGGDPFSSIENGKKDETRFRLRFAGFQAADPAEVEADRAAVDERPFALGTIEFTANVSIDFELTE